VCAISKEKNKNTKYLPPTTLSSNGNQIKKKTKINSGPYFRRSE
jgi:hypothetical protein